MLFDHPCSALLGDPMLPLPAHQALLLWPVTLPAEGEAHKCSWYPNQTFENTTSQADLGEPPSQGANRLTVPLYLPLQDQLLQHPNI